MVKKTVTKIYTLTCENASHLGGPMGTEYTTFMWSKPFSDVEKAKVYAEKYSKSNKNKINWERNGSEISWDSGPYIFIIKGEKVL